MSASWLCWSESKLFTIPAALPPPLIEEVCREVKAPPDAVTRCLNGRRERAICPRRRGNLLRRADDCALQQTVREMAQGNGSVTVAAFRDLTRTNRKFALQALEYFDKIRFTRASGDERTLFDARAEG